MADNDAQDDDRVCWLAASAAAAHLGIAVTTLWRLVDEGRVPAYRPAHHYRFRKADLDDYLEKVRVRPGTVGHRYGGPKPGSGTGQEATEG